MAKLYKSVHHTISLYVCPGRRSRSVSHPRLSTSGASQMGGAALISHFKVDTSSTNLLGDSDRLEHGYTLKDIIGKLGLDYDSLVKKIHKENGKGPRVLSDHLTVKFMEDICNEIDPNLVIYRDREIRGISMLSEMGTTTHQRPDGFAMNERKKAIALLYDVQSSPMENTEVRLILEAANVIRLMKNAEDSFDSFTAYGIPSINDKYPACIVQIEVQWKVPVFRYKIKCYRSISDGISAIKGTLTHYSESMPPIPTTIHPYFIRLSQSDISSLWPGVNDAQQLSSGNHIIVSTNTTVRKIIYDPSEEKCFFIADVAFRTCKPSRVIVPNLVRQAPLMYAYPKVRHGPLTRPLARSCLKALIKTLYQALNELHSMGLSYNDVRLPNICFNEQYEAVLIDLDRCYNIETLSPYFVMNVKSCMYGLHHMTKELRGNLTGKCDGQFTDFFQLGWLVAWIVGDDGDEHNRKWETQSTQIRDNEFIAQLIQNCAYNPELLETSFPLDDGRSIKSCVNECNM